MDAEDCEEGHPMNDMSSVEKARAAREARDTVAAAPPSHHAEAVDSALKRYLSAEQYRELRDTDQKPGAKPPPQTG
jgi:hypothetical protein